MSESDGNILFQTENNKTKKLQDEANLSEEERKIRFLTQLVEDLEKPKLTLTISSKTNNIGARLNQSMHYAHTSNHDKIHLDVYGMLNDNT